ncbi:MAG TPA: putative glycolipid-binding domain-containing protein [Kribbella sp.]|nr:putative glycolipid-binding domain-containing protein [Kribbella sp.]
MDLRALPPTASWSHVGVRVGFEVLFAKPGRLRGRTTAREDSSTWSVGYEIQLGADWRTSSVRAVTSTASGDREALLARGSSGWTVDGAARPDLEGCQDVDFESSAVTNTLPVHRLPFVVGEAVEVPAAFVRADDLSVERLEQRYTLVRTQERR